MCKIDMKCTIQCKVTMGVPVLTLIADCVAGDLSGAVGPFEESSSKE